MGMPDREVVAIIEMEVFKWPFKELFSKPKFLWNCSLKQWVLGMWCDSGNNCFLKDTLLQKWST
jgi:hypothetical protein